MSALPHAYGGYRIVTGSLPAIDAASLIQGLTKIYDENDCHACCLLPEKLNVNMVIGTKELIE